jgi:hypothetical protein
MTTNRKIENALTPAQLVAALDNLGVPFLRGASGPAVTIEPVALIAALATSHEARLRLALIPLLLAHPEFSVHAVVALQQLPPDAALTLRCYYTAAHWLQIKYRARIAAILGAMKTLPDTFSAELNLPESVDPNAALQALAIRQRELTGLTLNWLGTYEHAAQNWLRFMEYDNQWQQSLPIKSTPS